LPSGSSIEKGVATLPTRLTNASMVLAAADISFFPGYQAETLASVRAEP
jgi:hypothetical protein